MIRTIILLVGDVMEVKEFVLHQVDRDPKTGFEKGA